MSGDTLIIYRVETDYSKSPRLRQAEARRTPKGYKVLDRGVISGRMKWYFSTHEAFESRELALLDFERRQAEIQNIHESCARQCQRNREWVREMRRKA